MGTGRKFRFQKSFIGTRLYSFTSTSLVSAAVDNGRDEQSCHGDQSETATSVPEQKMFADPCFKPKQGWADGQWPHQEVPWQEVIEQGVDNSLFETSGDGLNLKRKPIPTNLHSMTQYATGTSSPHSFMDTRGLVFHGI